MTSFAIRSSDVDRRRLRVDAQRARSVQLDDERLVPHGGAQRQLHVARRSFEEQLAGELKRLSNSDRFDFIGQHRGMFSLLGTTPDMVETLRANNAIYMVPDSRMNIAGLDTATVPILAKAIIDAGI